MMKKVKRNKPLVFLLVPFSKNLPVSVNCRRVTERIKLATWRIYEENTQLPKHKKTEKKHTTLQCVCVV